MENKMNTKSVVTTALFVAVALVIRNFSINIAAGGILTMRISFAAIFYVLPGFLFGPLYGGIAGGLVDVLGYIMAPMGGYIPLLTITNIVAGALPALLWKLIKNSDVNKVKKFYRIFFIVMFLVGVINFLSIEFIPDTLWGKLLMMTGKRAQYFGVGFIIAASIGLLLFFVINTLNKKGGISYKYINGRYFKFVIVLGISGVIVSTLNTYILLIFTPALMTKGFMVLWIPRMFQTIFITLIDSYIVCLLVYYYNLVEKKIVQKVQ
ncbi:MAG: folate family ECF transporter S component [Clostridium sp.]|jgi:ECF transporter S component (folate family)|uniref:folate family ECF transporter S component n=1 Tax=Clostridium sp. TaxID=1506 RepID=UPI0025C43861|nr:folate family ECF transporter S component [Clostridium sp.]MCH3963794.1 folate family ECF transporter S component [Clostridium sp.]MCI1714935.1 folate family ECF transporter S component [Clostridium sp.]MCI1798876.1 folate family ECF transporter S component [Clostridium sp.]MCI1813118.1 folate family ECF transporter S component [Clostridium sp.]MCI1870008.1 folate family ECF transporter S component [Clostridium sp.]